MRKYNAVFIRMQNKQKSLKSSHLLSRSYNKMSLLLWFTMMHRQNAFCCRLTTVQRNYNVT